MAQLVCFFSLDIITEQICFLIVLFAVLLKQGNYIVNATEVDLSVRFPLSITFLLL